LDPYSSTVFQQNALFVAGGNAKVFISEKIFHPNKLAVFSMKRYIFIHFGCAGGAVPSRPANPFRSFFRTMIAVFSSVCRNLSPQCFSPSGFACKPAGGEMAR
jgi:hypothetical protein